MYFDQILKNSGPSISTYIMRELAGWKMSIIEVCALEPVRSTTTYYVSTLWVIRQLRGPNFNQF